MRKSKNIVFLLIMGLLGASAASHRQMPADSFQPAAVDSIDVEDLDVYDVEDTVSAMQADTTREYLPREVRDTAALMGQRSSTPRNYESRIYLLARTYGDSIVLRWAAEDYVSWQYLSASRTSCSS